MQQKHGKYYADWRDAKGKRHRKAFTSLKEAIKHTEKMRKAKTSRPNSTPQRKRLRKPLRAGGPAKRITPTQDLHSRP